MTDLGCCSEKVDIRDHNATWVAGSGLLTLVGEIGM